MHRGRLPACRCRHHRVDGLQRPSGRTASRGNTPSPITSPARRTARPRTEISPGARAHQHPAPPAALTPRRIDDEVTPTTPRALDARAPAQISSSEPTGHRTVGCRPKRQCRLLRSPLARLPQGDSDGARPPSDRQLHARPHCAYARDATRPAKWRFRGSSPSEHLVGTALGRPHSRESGARNAVADPYPDGSSAVKNRIRQGRHDRLNIAPRDARTARSPR